MNNIQGVQSGSNRTKYLPPVGSVVKYWYCRGIAFEGTCLIRGYDGWEVWCKTIEGTNHFGTANFVIAVDTQFTPIVEGE